MTDDDATPTLHMGGQWTSLEDDGGQSLWEAGWADDAVCDRTGRRVVHAVLIDCEGSRTTLSFRGLVEVLSVQTEPRLRTLARIMAAAAEDSGHPLTLEQAEEVLGSIEGLKADAELSEDVLAGFHHGVEQAISGLRVSPEVADRFRAATGAKRRRSTLLRLRGLLVSRQLRAVLTATAAVASAAMAVAVGGGAGWFWLSGALAGFAWGRWAPPRVIVRRTVIPKSLGAVVPPSPRRKGPESAGPPAPAAVSRPRQPGPQWMPPRVCPHCGHLPHADRCRTPVPVLAGGRRGSGETGTRECGCELLAAVSPMLEISPLGRMMRTAPDPRCSICADHLVPWRWDLVFVDEQGRLLAHVPRTVRDDAMRAAAGSGLDRCASCGLWHDRG